MKALTQAQLQDQIMLCKERKTTLLKAIATEVDDDAVDMYASLAEALAVVEIRSQILYVRNMRGNDDA